MASGLTREQAAGLKFSHGGRIVRHDPASPATDGEPYNYSWYDPQWTMSEIMLDFPGDGEILTTLRAPVDVAWINDGDGPVKLRNSVRCF